MFLSYALSNKLLLRFVRLACRPSLLTSEIATRQRALLLRK